MPRVLNPFDDGELFDSIELGGVRSPGIVKLSGHDREIDWDIKVGPGTTGGTTTMKAQKLVEFTATFYLVQDPAQGIDDLADWVEFDALIRSTISGPKAKALDIYHPDLATNGIKSVVMKSIGGVTHDGKGGQTVVVKLLEYRPPKPAKVTPLGARNKGPDPDAAAKAELAALTNQFQKTPWG